MDRLSIILTLMTGSVLTGAFLIMAFTFEHYNWTAILMCAAAGFVLSWPSGYFISRRIKKNDTEWDDTKVKDVDETIPRANAPEV